MDFPLVSSKNSQYKLLIFYIKYVTLEILCCRKFQQHIVALTDLFAIFLNKISYIFHRSSWLPSKIDLSRNSPLKTILCCCKFSSQTAEIFQREFCYHNLHQFVCYYTVEIFFIKLDILAVI